MTKINIIAIPFAGGNKYSYKNFGSFFPSNFHFVALELPGRGERIRENLLTDLNLMVEDLYLQIEPFITEHYIIYGHSMGGRLGNLLINKLKEKKRKMPIHIFISSSTSPIHYKAQKQFYLLNDADLKIKLKEYGGMPKKILDNDEIMSFFLPIFRADFQALETHNYVNNKHNVPLTAIVGTEENISDNELNGWGYETVSEYKARRYPGGHFFIYQHFSEIAELIMYEAQKVLMNTEFY